MMQSNNEPAHYRNGNAGVPATTNGGTLLPAGAGMMDPMAAAPAPNSDGGGQVDPKALLNAFRRRWFLAITVGLFCGGAAAAAVYMLVPPNYVAASLIFIKATPNTLLNDKSTVGDFDTLKKSHMYRATSNVVLAMALEEPIDNEQLQKFYKHVSDLPLIKSHEPYPEDWLGAHVSASGRQEEYFQIQMEHSESPQELAEIVNAITRVYLRHYANEEKDIQRKRIDQLKELSSEYQTRIGKIRQEIGRLARMLGVTNQEEATREEMIYRAFTQQLSEKWAALTLQKYNLEVEQAISEKINAEDSEEQPLPEDLVNKLVDNEQEMRDLLIKQNALENQLARTEATLKPDHPSLEPIRQRIAANEKSIEETREKLRPIVEQQIRDARNNTVGSNLPIAQQIEQLDLVINELAQQLDSRKQVSTKRTVDSLEMDNLNKDVAKLEAKKEQITDQIESLNIELQADDRIKLWQVAQVPRIQDWESLYKKAGMAGLGVFGLFVGAIVWFEFQAKRIDSLNDVTNGLNLRIMGALPNMPRAASKKSSKAKNAKSAFWHSVLTESIDAARTVLIRDANVESTRLVMVGSAISGEGKTTLSCHLAASLARVGRNTLLVDCDFRKANVHKVFGVDASPGLSEVLLGTATLEEAIKTPTDDGPAVLPAGQFNSQLLAALAQDGLGKIFEELKKRYEFIIIDSSPVLPVTDSLMVAQHVDAVILSIRRDVSRRPKVMATRDKLAMLGVPVLGAVVIGLDGESFGHRAGYYGYGYGYGSRYGYGYQYNRSPEPTPSKS